jgi:hypothetical protein
MTYQYNLFLNSRSIYLTLTIFGKCAVAHHCVLLVVVIVVDRNNQRIVVIQRFGEFVGDEVVHVKDDAAHWNHLVHARV